MSAAETLRKARAWLAEDPARWHRGSFGLIGRREYALDWNPDRHIVDGVVCACAAGAILLVEPEDVRRGFGDMLGDDLPALRALAKAIVAPTDSEQIDAVYGDDKIRWLEGDAIVWNIGGWNDHPLRTHAEVLTAFDRAIAIAKTEAA